jgi:hypothetical protein
LGGLMVNQLILRSRLVAETNVHRDPKAQFSYWYWSPLKTRDVMRAHRDSYPSSRVRLGCVLNTFAIVAVFLVWVAYYLPPQ